MFASRISSLFKSASSQQPLTYFFGFLKQPKYTSRQTQKVKLTPILTQIASARTIDEYCRIIEQNKTNFPSDILDFAIGKISKLLRNNRDESSYKEMNNILTTLAQIDVQTLTASNIVAIYNILRRCKATGGFNYKTYIPYKEELQKKYVTLLQKTQIGPQNIQFILYSYLEFAIFSCSEARKAISSKLIAYIEQPQPNNQPKFTHNQIVFAMKCLASNEQPLFHEITIRAYLMEQIKGDLDQISINNLVQICHCLQNMDLFDLQHTESEVLKDVLNLIAEEIPTMHQSMMLQLVQNKLVSKQPGFIRIYVKILNRIYAQIDENGHSTLNADIVLNIFNFLSKKLSLEDTDQQNQDKFFAYLATQLSHYNLNNTLYHLVQNNFFNKQQSGRLLNILKIHQVEPTVKLMYIMSINDYDMSQYAEQLTRLNVNNRPQEFIYQTIIILNKLKNKSTAITGMLKLLLANIIPNFQTPQSFIKFYKSIRDNRDYNIYQINEVLHEYFARLPNPFQSALKIQQYRFFYLEYVFNSLSSRDFLAFLHTHDAKIQLSDTIGLITVYLRVSIKNLVAEKSLTFMLNSRISQIMETKNKHYIKESIHFLTKYNRFAVYQILDWEQQTQLFQIIYKMFNKASVLVQTGLILGFGTMLNKYLARNHRNYNLEFNYRHLLDLVIRNISLFEGNWMLVRTAVEQSIRLNTLIAKHVQTIDLKRILFTSHLIRMQAYHIKDRFFIYDLSKAIKKEALVVLLSNQNYAKYISEHKDEMLETIKTSSIPTLFSCAVHYNQPNSPATMRIISQILRSIRDNIIMFQNYDIIGFFRNANDRNFYFYDQCKQITQNIVRFMTNRPVPMASLSTHLEVIKFIIKQPQIETNEYYSNLVEFYSKQGGIPALVKLYYWLSHTSYPFKNEQLNIVQHMITMNDHPFNATFFFLMLEHKMQPQYRSQIVRQLSIMISQEFKNSTINQQGESSYNINSGLLFSQFDRMKCQYLKSAYPQQTKPLLSIPEHELTEPKFAFKVQTLMQLLKQIAKITQNPLVLVTQFGQRNHIVKIKDCVFVAVSGKRVGALYEHEFIKRALIQLIDEPVYVVCLINRYSAASNLHNIVKNCPGLMSAEQIARIKNSNTKTNKEDYSHSDSQ